MHARYVNAADVAKNWRVSTAKRCQLSSVASVSHVRRAAGRRTCFNCQRQLILVSGCGH